MATTPPLRERKHMAKDDKVEEKRDEVRLQLIEQLSDATLSNSEIKKIERKLALLDAQK